MWKSCQSELNVIPNITCPGHILHTDMDHQKKQLISLESLFPRVSTDKGRAQNLDKGWMGCFRSKAVDPLGNDEGNSKNKSCETKNDVYIVELFLVF